MDRRCRPNVSSTENQKILPGNSNYVNETKYVGKIMMIGDSHIKRMKMGLFNNSFETVQSKIKSFNGAKTQELKHEIIPSLAEQKPDIAVVHIG